MTIENIRLIFEGKKTETRRIIHIDYKYPNGVIFGGWTFDGLAEFLNTRYGGSFLRKPRYRVGDLCWLPEPFKFTPKYDHLKPSKVPEDAEVWYADQIGWNMKYCGRYRNARFMLKRLARKWIEILEVLPPHRIQDITENDAIAEGMEEIGEIKITGRLRMKWRSYQSYIDCTNAVSAFSTEWNMLHGFDAWELNSWVIPYRFRKIKNPNEQ